jgi:hypothetical protein
MAVAAYGVSKVTNTCRRYLLQVCVTVSKRAVAISPLRLRLVGSNPIIGRSHLMGTPRRQPPGPWV